MYETFEVKTGGVINAKTKSGTNECKAGANFYWEPDALREQRDSSRNNVNNLYRIDAAVIEWTVANDYGDVTDIWDGFHQYVLTHPNADMRIGTTELPGAEGELVYMDLSPKDLGYPDSVRKYAAVDFMCQRAWYGVWMLKTAYTWSHNLGNNEGYVRSDNGQYDVGLTTLFDQPGLLGGAYGDLRNDRHH